MEKNFIILAHKNPKQILRLIHRLDDGESYFYIHLDMNVDIGPFVTEFTDQSKVRFVEKREKGTWGDIGIVKATINSMNEILADKRKGYCILLSGQDYPLKNNVSINSFLDLYKGTDFIDLLPAEEVWPQKWYSRLNFYKIKLSDNRGDFVSIPSLFQNDFYSLSCLKNFIKGVSSKNGLHFLSIAAILITKKRKPIHGIQPFGGSQWWALCIETVTKIIKFIDENPDYVKYHTYTLLPDEIFFHSIVKHLASSDKSVRISESVTYVNWKRKNCDLPVTFNYSDIDELTYLPESKLFARKFDTDFNEEILTLLDSDSSLN